MDNKAEETTNETIPETWDDVKSYYRAAAAAGPERMNCSPTDERWGTARYDSDLLTDAPEEAAGLSMGCGNPYLIADLRPGETVLDLGSGAGLDVILSAKRVGPDGKAYGVDFLDEMLELAQANASKAGVNNVEFLAGMIEAVPLPDHSIDVVISNCVINLAPNKRPVFAEIHRVLQPGGRLAISDVLAQDDRQAREDDAETWAECGSGALGISDYKAQLAEAGLSDITIELTHDVGRQLHGAVIRAVKADEA